MPVGYGCGIDADPAAQTRWSAIIWMEGLFSTAILASHERRQLSEMPVIRAFQ
jgi:hypothetical protein